MTNNDKQIKVRVQAAIFDRANNLLLARHEKDGRSYWVLPGGGVEFGERLDQALKRELKEELGIEHCRVMDPILLDNFIPDDMSRHVILIAFRVEVHADQLSKVKVVTPEESIKDIGFFNRSKLKVSAETFYPSRKTFLELIDTVLNPS